MILERWTRKSIKGTPLIPGLSEEPAMDLRPFRPATNQGLAVQEKANLGARVSTLISSMPNAELTLGLPTALEEKLASTSRSCLEKAY